MPRAIPASALLATLLLAGCASNVPLEIQNAVPGSPGVAAASTTEATYTGQKVRWGGTVVSVETRAEDSLIELVAKELGGYGRPRETDLSEGRFLAKVPGFVDPNIYSEDRELTVYGTLDQPVTRNIGERPYTYPLVIVEKLHLWPKYEPVAYPPYPYHYYDPFMYPYGPWYRHRWGYWPYW